MNLFYSVFLGLLQGATEFLPVSSSAHLVLAEAFVGLEQTGLPYDVALHLGTLAAILIYFRHDFLLMTKSLFQSGEPAEDLPFHRKMVFYLGIGTVPAVIAALLFGQAAETALRSPLSVAAMLSGFGLLLLLADKFGRRTRQLKGLILTDCLLIGLAQALAIMPGVSRSGVTITAALLLGLRRMDAARFSFLLSAPVILGAGVYNLPEIISQGLAADQLAFYLSGFLASMISGYLFISFLLRFVQVRSLAVFAYYRFLLAALVSLTVIL